MNKTLGVLPLARSTFDVAFAEEMAALAFARLDATGHRIIGPRDLLFDAESAKRALAELRDSELDLLLILQITFTDATMTVTAAAEVDAPLAIWAVPEPRLGGRLRLNAYCGLNLAAHALGLNQRDFSYLYADPARESCATDLADLIAGRRRTQAVEPTRPSASEKQLQKARDVVGRLSGRRFARIGEHPDGFDTCAYNSDSLRQLVGIEVDRLTLDELFQRARAVSDDRLAETRERAEREMSGLETLDQPQLERSLRLKNALEELREQGDYAAFAIRCWPETFTEYGGAVCGPVSMMSEQRVPCACEADVFGALSSLLLQELADAPAFQVDLVDIDPDDGSSVVWHCGQAPISMADPASRPTATIHSNRKMPLLYEFALKPGRVTFARVSQARGEIKLVIAGGEMLARPGAFTGTSGVVAYDAPPERLEEIIMGGALEHHSCMVYGDFRDELRAVAQVLDIPCLEIA